MATSTINTSTLGAPNAVLSLGGAAGSQVYFTSNGIYDTSGNLITLPTNANIDPNSGNIVQNGKVIGTLTASSSTTKTTNDNTATTPSTSTGSGTSTTSTTSNTTSGTSTNTGTTTSTTKSTGPTAAATVPTTTLFAGARNLKDGGALNPGSSGTGTGSGSSSGSGAPGAIPISSANGGGGGGGGSAADSSGSGAPAPTPAPQPGPWGINNPQHSPAPKGTYDVASPPLSTSGLINKIGSVAGIAGAALGVVSFLGSKISVIGNFLTKYPALASTLKWAGVALAGWGVFSSIWDLRNGASGWAAALDWISLGVATAILLASGPIGWAVLAAAVIISLLIPKKDRDVDPTQGDVVGNTNTDAPVPPGWAQALPVQSVFMILAGITSIGLGMGPGYAPFDLTSAGPQIQQDIIPSSLVPTFNQTFIDNGHMGYATNTTITGGPLGKVFIKAGDGTTANPDKVMYVTEYTDGSPGCSDPNHPCEAVNMVSLNTGGYITSPFGPNVSAMVQPFYGINQSGAVTPNPGAFNALGQMLALAKVPQGGGTATGAEVAINMAALEGKNACIGGACPTAAP